MKNALVGRWQGGDGFRCRPTRAASWNEKEDSYKKRLTGLLPFRAGADIVAHNGVLDPCGSRMTRRLIVLSVLYGDI